jgi:protein SPT2
MFYTGLVQPDEDDYGYVSQEASAFYNKLMEKYSSTPSDEPKTSKKSFLKSSAADLNNTKVYIFIFLQYLRTIMIILIV